MFVYFSFRFCRCCCWLETKYSLINSVLSVFLTMNSEILFQISSFHVRNHATWSVDTFKFLSLVYLTRTHKTSFVDVRLVTVRREVRFPSGFSCLTSSVTSPVRGCLRRLRVYSVWKGVPPTSESTLKRLRIFTVGVAFPSSFRSL